MKLKRFSAILLCLISIFSICSTQVFASGPIETETKCNLAVTFATDGVIAKGVTFRVYKIASITRTCEFEPEEPFADQSVMSLLETPDAESYSIIASTLSGVIAADDTLTPTATAVTNDDGTAVFADLETGLYFITGEVFHGPESFYIPYDYLVCLPDRLEDDTWNYNVVSNVKWEKTPDSDPIDLQALKVWSDSSTELHADDKVTVELYKNGELFDTQILSKDNDWKYDWTGLYGGAAWTVKEKEVSGYSSTVERKGDCFVVTNTADEDDGKIIGGLPHTGLLWWPVPILIVCGIALVIVGIYARKKGNKNGN